MKDHALKFKNQMKLKLQNPPTITGCLPFNPKTDLEFECP